MSRALTAALNSARQLKQSNAANPLGITSSLPALNVLTRSESGSNTGTNDPPPTYAESKNTENKRAESKVSVTPSSPITPCSNPAEDVKPQTNDVPLNSTSTSRRKVLLVEDNAINMKLLVATMRKLKRPHETAENGLEAITKYASSPTAYALVLMDISMPVMDGFTATEMLRAMEEKNGWERCRIMALTGVGDAEAKKRAFLAGVDGFMTKPVSMQTLSGLVKEIED